MITYLILLLIILILAVLYVRVWRNNKAHYEGMQKALEDHNKSVLAYNELDKGMTEITDAYETDSLQYEDTIEKLNEHAALRESKIAELSTELARVRENNATLLHNAQVDRTARHEMARRLDIAQVIISDHDLNCLPHIVLTSMEQDTPLPL